MVAVVEVDVGFGDSERTEFGDLVIPFVLCQEGGGAFSLDGVSRASCSLPYSEKTVDTGRIGRPELCRSVHPLPSKTVPQRRRHLAKRQALCVHAVETHSVNNQSIRV